MSKTFASGPPWHRRRVGVLSGASLAVYPGELVGLVGENGHLLAERERLTRIYELRDGRCRVL